MEELPHYHRVESLQMFQVTEIKCHCLTVTVLRGENITKGKISDYLDTPDPYIVLWVKGIPRGKVRTKTISNNKNPKLNEKFTFHLDPSREYKLDITLSEDNIIADEELGSQSIDLKILRTGDEVTKILNFEKIGKIHLKLLLEEDVEPDLRYSTDLCDQEKEFLEKRKEIVLNATKNILGPIDSPKNVEEIPIIGVLASGGGYRALIGYAGALAALDKSGILDCVTYIAGLSGSSWCLAWLFSHPDFFTKGPSGLLKELKKRLSVKSYKSAMRNITNDVQKVKKKMDQKLPVSLTDLFGHLVGEMLLKDKKYFHFTNVREKLKDSKAPFPLCTCLNVKKNVSAHVFGEWIEFSPYEVGWAKYGIFMDMKYFGSLFYMGNIIQQFPEVPLHFLLGCWGNAFSIITNRILPGGDSDVFNKKTKVPDEPHSPCRKILTRRPIVEKDSLVTHRENGSIIRRLGSRRAKPPEIEPEESLKEKLWPGKDVESDLEDNEDDVRNGNNEDPEDDCQQEESMTDNRISEEDVEDLDDENEEGVDEKKEGYGLWPMMVIKAIKRFKSLQKREVRAGRVFNPLRGLPIQTKREIQRCISIDDFEKGINESVEREDREQCLVDSGLSFNLPFPLLLRPQRGIEIYLSFDFSTRPTDWHEPFREIILAEKWAKMNSVPFPPVKELAQKYCKQPMREIYTFSNPKEPNCPVIIHFILFNNNFRENKEPGVPRTTKEERDFAAFDIFSDPNDSFSMFNFKYSGLNFDRLSKLTEFNTLLGLDTIKEQMKIVVKKKQNRSPQRRETKIFNTFTAKLKSLGNPRKRPE